MESLPKLGRDLHLTEWLILGVPGCMAQAASGLAVFFVSKSSHSMESLNNVAFQIPEAERWRDRDPVRLRRPDRQD